MKVSRLFGVPAAIFLTLVCSARAQTAEFPYPKVGYSADVTMDMGKDPDGQSMILKGKVYFSNEKERRETTGFGRKNIIIWRRDKGVTWHLMPEQKMYMESRGHDKNQDPERMMRESDVTITQLAKEQVNGMPTTKFRIEATHKDGTRFVGHHWATKENIPVRMEGSSKGQPFRIDYTNIEIGNQDSGLFEIPADYQRMVMPELPGWPPTGMRPGGEMPASPPPGMTKEQIEQMRKQMDEMRRRMQGR